jgi:uroporphyrinogen decarboxylase
MFLEIKTIFITPCSRKPWHKVKGGNMNSRERVRTALEIKEPDRVPLDLGMMAGTITYEAQEKLKKYLRIDSKDFIYNRAEGTVIPNEKILEYLKIDTRYIYLNGSSGWKDIELGNDMYKDEFGVIRKRGCWYYDVVESPFKNANNPEEIEKHPWPNPRDMGRYEGVYEKAKFLFENTDYALASGNVEIGCIFENAWYMTGFQKFMENFYLNPVFNEALLDKWTEYYINLADELFDRIGNYLEFVTVGDDITDQRGPLISPEIYRKFIKPRQKKLFSFIKNKTKAKLYYHLCGTVNEFIEDLIEIGIDVLQPIQKEAAGNDLKELKRKYGNKLSFCGGVSQQKVLPHGNTSEVRTDVRDTLKALAPGGGYLFITGHNIQPDVPPENIVAAYDEAYKFGVYPIQ